jgi:hypothetical protein
MAPRADDGMKVLSRIPDPGRLLPYRFPVPVFLVG